MRGPRRALEAVRHVVGVFVLVDVHRHVVTKVDGVGAGDPGAVVIVGIEHLHGHRDPAARAATEDEPRPTLTDAAKALFDLGDEFVLDGVAVRPVVRRVDAVGVVVEGRRVLDLDQQHARETLAGPGLEELPLELLLDAVVTRELEALAVVGLERGIGRRLAPARRRRRKVAVVDHERIARARMVVEALRQGDEGAEVRVATPELRETLAADADVFDPRRVLELRQRRDDLAQYQLRQRACVESATPAQRHGSRVEIARLLAPLLTFALVGGQLEHAAVAQAERLVAVEEGLHPVVAGWQIGDGPHRKTEGRRIDFAAAAGAPALDVEAEERDRVAIPIDEEAGLPGGRLIGRREDQEQAAVLGAVAQTGRQLHLERVGCECGGCGKGEAE